MATRAHVGPHELLPRLTAQVGSEELARALLIKRGDMRPNGKLTAKGKKRDSMTAEERAVDRAARASGRPKNSYKYNPATNRATLKGKK
jgi:hypothetical protein